MNISIEIFPRLSGKPFWNLIMKVPENSHFNMNDSVNSIRRELKDKPEMILLKLEVCNIFQGYRPSWAILVKSNKPSQEADFASIYQVIHGCIWLIFSFKAFYQITLILVRTKCTAWTENLHVWQEHQFVLNKTCMYKAYKRGPKMTILRASLK